MNKNCRFVSIKDIWENRIRFAIPDIQRGLVWNAAQIEVLWDSLLREIPIGLFSVADSAGELILLDGQQRWHAINIANPRQSNEYGVLWCAILSDSSRLNLYNRKYLFRWTTDHHPWGFRWDENERSAPRLNIYERRKVLDRNGKKGEELFKRPSAGDIYPFPYGEEEITMVKFQSLLEEHDAPKQFSDSQKKYWHDLKSRIEEVINQPVIPLMGDIQRNDISQKNGFSGQD